MCSLCLAVLDRVPEARIDLWVFESLMVVFGPMGLRLEGPGSKYYMAGFSSTSLV